MTLTTKHFHGSPLRSGIPEYLREGIEEAANGNAKALLWMAQESLSEKMVGLIGEPAALAAAEAFACLAAVNGGTEARKFLVTVYERQAEHFRDNVAQRHACLWQIASIYDALADDGVSGADTHAARTLRLLVEGGDLQASGALAERA